ncbi:hypothetical protein B7463_g7612, partial [Scytalidium lignicola]
MAPLIRNMSWHDAKWSKFKRSYMWNKVYYLRRTKFTVYQLATTIVNVTQGLGIAVLKGFPDAHIDTSDIVGSFAFNIFSCLFIALLFGAAVFFDLFWPERKEARCIQWTWKLSAAASSVFQLGAALATTIVVVTHSPRISGVSVEQENAIRENWKGTPLVYQQENLALAAVAFCWVEWLFTFWRPSCAAAILSVHDMLPIAVYGDNDDDDIYLHPASSR